ncbi:MAG: hypothetical protein WCX13_03305 [Candidatus Hydrogenedentales bacterium]
MKTRQYLLSAAMSLLVLFSAFPQGADPKTVTPAWILEKQFEQQQEEKKLANTADTFNVFFIGYDYPLISGPLAAHLDAWKSPLNFSFGMETSMSNESSFLTGVEGELFMTFNDQGSFFLMNDMVMFGYSINLKPVRLNMGVRAGFSILDVMGTTETYTGLGLIIGPEASMYLAFAPGSWLWLRGRYAMAGYMSMDSSSNPISQGDDSLTLFSLEAGLAFKL